MIDIYVFQTRGVLLQTEKVSNKTKPVNYKVETSMFPAQ